MKLIHCAGMSLAALFVASCATGAKSSADVRRTQAERDDARAAAQEARLDAEAARNDAKKASQAEEQAEQEARIASQRAAEAERQAPIDSQARVTDRMGVTEMQPADTTEQQRTHEGLRQRQGATERQRDADKNVIPFESDSADLSPDAKSKLDVFVEGLPQAEKARDHFRIQGFADDAGGDASNKKLSERRAARVAIYLESKGVSSSQVTTEGLGAGHEAAKAHKATGHMVRRGVVILAEPATR
jgi:outer membrane protein OmpA-like peptidoglycan-associated protein